jgi:hypothetical protein
MLTFALFCLPVPVNLDALSLERARLLHGRVVVASFVVAPEPYTLTSHNAVGSGERSDGVIRATVLRRRAGTPRNGSASRRSACWGSRPTSSTYASWARAAA